MKLSYFLKLSKALFFICLMLIAAHCKLSEDKSTITRKSHEAHIKDIINNYRETTCTRIFFPSNHKLKTDRKVIALTFDACGNRGGDKYNKKLINILMKHNTKATLFISGIWIRAHYNTFLKLSKNRLFLIANHGTLHRIPLLCNKQIYGIKSTENIRSLINEVHHNSLYIERITGTRPLFYRGATGHYDINAIKAIQKMGYEIVNGNNAAFDFSKKISSEELFKNMKKAKPGSIIAAHMNQPEHQIHNAIEKIILYFRSLGYEFVHLNEYDISNNRY